MMQNQARLVGSDLMMRYTGTSAAGALDLEPGGSRLTTSRREEILDTANSKQELQKEKRNFASLGHTCSLLERTILQGGWLVQRGTSVRDLWWDTRAGDQVAFHKSTARVRGPAANKRIHC